MSWLMCFIISALRRAQTQPLQRTASDVSTLSEMDDSTQDSFIDTLNVEVWYELNHSEGILFSQKLRY